MTISYLSYVIIILMITNPQNRIDIRTTAPYTSGNTRIHLSKGDHAYMTPELNQLSVPQRDRLAFLELLLSFMGEFQRHDLVTRFGIQSRRHARHLVVQKPCVPAI